MYMAKAVKVPNGVHICYCHTPPRFLYGYPTSLNWRKNPILRPIGEVINHFMRVWDFEAAQPPKGQGVGESESQSYKGRVDYFIANSKEVQARIKKFYRRDSKVIYPPVDIKKFTVHSRQFTEEIKTVNREPLAHYFMVVSRLVGAKRVDLAVKACAKLGLPLKVVGTGRGMEVLKQLASQLTVNCQLSTVQFLGEVSDQELIILYHNCRAVIFPAEEEDFGLVPVEAMIAGKPVI